MKLTLQSDYALRILMTLHDNKARIVSVDEIAQKFSISKNHLTKISRALCANGYVKTVRGRNGGMELACEADQIKIGDVICAMEPDMNVVECFGRSNCALLPGCGLKPLLGLAIKAFVAELNKKTLFDICKQGFNS